MILLDLQITQVLQVSLGINSIPKWKSFVGTADKKASNTWINWDYLLCYSAYVATARQAVNTH